MRLMRDTQVPEGGSLVTLRTSWLSTLFTAVAFSGIVAAGVFVLAAAAQDAPSWALVLSAPSALVGAVIAWLILSTVWGALRASLLESNWTLKIGRGGLWLHLRSYQNHAFEEAEQTAAFFPFAELQGARKYVERQRVGMSGDAEARVAMLELLVAKEHTEELKRAVQRERQREGPTRRFLGATSRMRSNHVPVLVAAPGRVRVLWHGRKVLRLLAEEGVELLPKARDLPEGERTRDPDDEILALIERGLKIKAIGLVRETYGMGLAEAKEFVEDLSSRPAA